MVTIEQLYKDYGVLADAKDKAGEHEDTYRSILSAVEASGSEKRLASQFIPRFFKYFPNLAEQAINAQLDLCEDDDSSIRRQAIKELPNLCKDNKAHLLRIADVLTQLLQSEDTHDLSTVNGALIALFKIDAKGTLGGLFGQIIKGEDTVRERAIKFLSTKFMTFSAELITKEVEELLVEKSKEVLQDVNGEEFVTFITILSKLESMQTLTGRKQLVDLVAEQADLKAEFEHTESDCVDRLIQCIQQAQPFFSRNVPSTKFVVYLCDHVLPVLDKIVIPGEISEASGGGDKPAPPKVDIKLDFVKLLAEMSCFTGDLESDTALSNVFTTLLTYMPLPPAVTESESATDGKNTTEETDETKAKEEDTEKAKEEDTEKAKEEDTEKSMEEDTEKTKEEDTEKTKEEDTEKTKEEDTEKAKDEDKEKPKEEDPEKAKEKDEPKLQFSYVECLMFTFHQIATKQTEFLTGEEHADRLKDFRLRLQYFARGTQLYMKQLRLTLRGKNDKDLKSDENKLKLVALKVTTNINVLIKDLFHNPPSYKSSISLSWKPAQRHPSASSDTGSAQQVSQKRSNITPISFPEGAPAAKKKAVGGGGGGNRNNKNRGQRNIYSPPGGKYSNKAGAAPTVGDADYGSGFGGGRGQNQYRKRGRGRGRGGGGGWRY